MCSRGLAGLGERGRKRGRGCGQRIREMERQRNKRRKPERKDTQLVKKEEANIKESHKRTNALFTFSKKQQQYDT